MIHAAPPAPPAFVVTAPAEREVSFGHIAGRVPRGKWAIVVRADEKLVAVERVAGGSFEFVVALPRRDTNVRVSLYGPGGRRQVTKTIRRVFGLPRSAAPQAAAGSHDGALQRTVGMLARAFPGTSGVYVEDLVSGHGASWNARARFPAASTLKLAIAVEALRTHGGKPEPESYLDSLLRRMLIESDNDAANEVESLFGGGTRVDELLRGLGLGDTWMGGGYLRGTAFLPPIPVRVESQPSFPCCKYTTAYDLARLLAWVHLAAGGRGPLVESLSGFTPSDARYLLYLLAHVPDRGKLGRYLAGGPYALMHKAGWISYARHDAGLVYWPGGVFVAAVMTTGSGVGAASDLLAARIARVTLERVQRLGREGLTPKGSVPGVANAPEPLGQTPSGQTLSDPVLQALAFEACGVCCSRCSLPLPRRRLRSRRSSSSRSRSAPPGARRRRPTRDATTAGTRGGWPTPT